MTTTSQFKKQCYFSFEALDKSYDSFRLLTIQPGRSPAPLQCTLSHERISDVEDGYCALSYTWGKRATERWIRLNGTPFMIQPSLFEALQAIRKEDEQINIWADGICIDQSDTAERNHQVGLMGKIYSSAKNVRVWLGPAADDSDFVLDYVERAEARFQREQAGEKVDGDEEPDEEEQKAFLEAFRALHRRPYWSRAWIKQEVILAKDLIIHCGTKSANGLRLLVEAHWHCFWPFGVGGHNALTDEIANLSMHRVNRQNNKREPLEVLLKRYGRTGCTDVRDRVFSLLSIAADCEGREENMVDYSISLPALFFSILGFVKPKHVISLATTLHEILGLRRADILDYWDKVESSLELGQDAQPPPSVDSNLENVGILIVWGIKLSKQLMEMVEKDWPEYVGILQESISGEGDLPGGLGVLSDPFFVRCSLLLDSQPRTTREFYASEADGEEGSMEKGEGREGENEDRQPLPEAPNISDAESEDGQEGEVKEGDNSRRGQSEEKNRFEGVTWHENDSEGEATDDDHALTQNPTTENPSEKAEREEMNREPAGRSDHTLLQISATDYFIAACKTIFGLCFLYIFRRENDASAENGIRLDRVISKMSSNDLEPFMVYPQIALRRRTESLLGRVPNPLSLMTIKQTLKRRYGTIVLNPPIDVMCCILLELDMLSGDRGICTNGCQYVLEACGYELTQLGGTLAQFRIQAEHERSPSRRVRMQRRDDEIKQENGL